MMATVVTKMKDLTKTSQFGLYKHNTKGDGLNCRMCSASFKCTVGVLVIVFGILTVACVSYDLTKEPSMDAHHGKFMFKNNSRTPRSQNNSNETSSKEQEVMVERVNSDTMQASKRQDVDILSLYSSSNEQMDNEFHPHFITQDMMSFPKEYEPKYSAEQEFMRQIMLPTPVPESFTEDTFRQDMRGITLQPAPGPFKYVMQGVQPTEFTIRKPKTRRKKTSSSSLSSTSFPAVQGHQHSPQNIQEIINYLQTNGNGHANKKTAAAEDANIPKFTGIYKRKPTRPTTRPAQQTSRKKVLTVTPPKSEHIATRLANDDPFFEYKPANPSDINLLAINNFRFATPLYMYGKLKNKDARHKSPDSESQFTKRQPSIQKLHQQQQIKQLQHLQKYQQVQAAMLLQQQQQQQIQQQQQKSKNPLSIILDLFPGNADHEGDAAGNEDYEEYNQRHLGSKMRHPHAERLEHLQEDPNPSKMVVHLNMHANNLNEEHGP